MSFQPLSRILPQAIRSAGIAKQVTAARVVAEAQATVARLWGEEKAAYVTAASFADGTLKVRTESSAAAQELRLWEARIVNELNRRLGSRAVLKFEIRSL